MQVTASYNADPQDDTLGSTQTAVGQSTYEACAMLVHKMNEATGAYQNQAPMLPQDMVDVADWAEYAGVHGGRFTISYEIA